MASRMQIIFHYESPTAERWMQSLREQLPHADIRSWQPGSPRADYAVAWAPPQALIDEQTDLKALFNIGAGVDKLLGLRIPPALRLVRIDDAGMGVQMAEYVCHALLRHLRRFDVYEEQARQGRWQPHAGRARAQFPVGVMGLGVLGRRVVQAVQHFGFPVRGWSRSPHRIDGVQCYAGDEAFEPFLRGTRMLVCLLPWTPQTENLLDRRTLSMLLPEGYLVNVARGHLLVEQDLLALLDNGHLAGATLDVFRTEPLPPEHAFWRHPRIHVTPHVSAQTLRDESMEQIAGKIRALEAGLPVAGEVDLIRGY